MRLFLVIRKNRIWVIPCLFTYLLMLFGCEGNSEQVSKSKHYTKRIINVLEQDKQCSSQKTSEQYAKMCRISLDGCPIDFCEAYNEHKKAWSDAVSFMEEVEQYKEKANSGEAIVLGMIEGFLGGLAGDPTYGCIIKSPSSFLTS